jgi:hypothetical protein
MVSMTVMILSYLVAAVVVVNVSSLDFGYSQVRVNNSTNESTNNVTHVNETWIDLLKNPNFTFFNDTSRLPSYWSDSLKYCRTIFSCTIKFTDGWNDYVSFALSTTNNTNKTWSSIYGKQIEVESKIKYQLVSHMKLNKWATQSHIAVEAFNETSNGWYQIAQCPSGINGPLEWHELSCELTITSNITKIRPVLNAGWSSQPNKEGTTWFDSIALLAKFPTVRSADR